MNAYRERYPTAPLVDEAEKLRASAHAKLHNKPGISRPDVGLKISATKALRKDQGVDYGAKLRGISKSEEAKSKLSAAVKHAYENGRVHWATGRCVAEETKAKISESLTIFFEPQVTAKTEQRLIETARREAAQKSEKIKYQQLLISDLAVANIGLENVEANYAFFKCISCNNTWRLTKQYLDQTRRSKISCRACNPRLTTSIMETELFGFVKVLCADAIQGDRSVLGGRELDVLVPSLRLAFEFNGLYWHSELVRGSPKHMLWKQQHAYKLGYRLFHIFEDEWLNKRAIVESRIKAILKKLDKKLDARKLQLVAIENAEKRQFLEANHLQGDDIAGIRYGLKTLDGALVACMTFKKTSYVKGGTGDDYELSRFATLNGWSIRGAAGKLLSAFMKAYTPSKLISYADRRWSFGQLYSSLGFKFESFSPPSYWYTLGYKDRKHRAGFMKHMLVAAGHDKAKTEWQIMQELGYDRIWDCGTLKFSLAGLHG